MCESSFDSASAGSIECSLTFPFRCEAAFIETTDPVVSSTAPICHFSQRTPLTLNLPAVAVNICFFEVVTFAVRVRK